jgi:hypothetical protein
MPEVGIGFFPDVGTTVSVELRFKAAAVNGSIQH